MKKFAIVTKNQGIYTSVKTVANDIFLETLTAVFTDGLSFAKDILEDLQDPRGRGMAGNVTRIEIEGQTITIGYFYADDEAITIDRQQLIRIMTKVIDLMEKEADYLVLTQEHEGSSVAVSDTLPEGFELYTEDKQLKYRYNPLKAK